MDVEPAPVAVVAGVWPESAAAERALHAFRADGWVASARIHGAATLVVDQAGDLSTTDVAGRAGEGAVGGLLGATLGLLTSGIGWLSVDTAAIDSLAGEARRGGLRDGRLLRLGEQVSRRWSALVAVVQRSSLDVAVLELETTGAETVSEPVDDALLARLSDGAPAWPGRADLGTVIAMRSGAVVLRELESTPAARV